MKVRAGLSAAACALLGAVPPTAYAVDLETGLLFYTEFDRVSLIESRTRARRSLGPGKFLNFEAVIDVLTGASPNGALPAGRPQTFTHPSGRGGYITQAGDLPLENIFQDNRFGFAGGIDLPAGSESRVTANAGASVEYDYRSITFDGSFRRAFDRRNTTVTIAMSLAHDVILPEGGIPVPFASMADIGAPQPRTGRSETKDTIEGLASVTQIFSRTTLGQINFAVNRSSGYETDPFKLLTVIDGAAGDDLGRPLGYVYERRPNRRTKRSLFAKMKRSLSGDVADLSYRYQWDDWGLESHTLETHYRRGLGGASYLEPRFRLYHQSGVDFFRHSLVSGEAFPEFATADSRQAHFDGVTAGFKFGRDSADAGGWSVRVEYYRQIQDGFPKDARGQQKERDLIPDLGALITQFTYSFDRW